MYPRLIIGDSYEFRTTVADYPASDGWALSHVLRPASGSADPITLTAVADGDDYLTSVSTTTSAGWEAGDFTVVAMVTKAGERHTLDAVALSGGRLTSNRITILANPTDGEAFDDRSHARKTLDALNAMIEGRASMEQRGFTIRDRTVDLLSPDELIRWRGYYAGIVANEDAAARRRAGLPDPRRKYVRFMRP